MEQNKNQKVNPDTLSTARIAEILAQVGHISKKSLYINNFLRGVFFGAGSLLGATIVIAMVIWILSLFDAIPFIGPLIENTTETIKNNR